MERDARRVLLDPGAAVVELDRVFPQPRARRVEQRLVQVGAMDRELRPVVAGVAAARLLEDELAMAAVEGELARLDALRRERLLQAELRQFAHGVRQEVDAGAHDQDVCVAAAHSAAIPRLATTSAQRALSRTTISARAAGVEVVGIKPCASNTWRASAASRMAAVSRLRRAIVSGGVPFGANRPYHMSTSAPFSPCSIRVGVSGSCGRRLGLPTASAFSLPARMYWAET